MFWHVSTFLRKSKNCDSSLVSLDVVDHVAHLWRLNIASKTPEELIRATCGLVYDKVFCEAHVAGIRAESVTDSSFCNYFLVGKVLFAYAVWRHHTVHRTVEWLAHHRHLLVYVRLVMGHHVHSLLSDGLEIDSEWIGHHLIFLIALRVVIIYFDCHHWLQLILVIWVWFTLIWYDAHHVLRRYWLLNSIAIHMFNCLVVLVHLGSQGSGLIVIWVASDHHWLGL